MENYEIFPMASNVQVIFYRPEGSTDPADVLVKVLLNERETTLPVATAAAPYYKWSDLRDYYLKNSNGYPTELTASRQKFCREANNK